MATDQFQAHLLPPSEGCQEGDDFQQTSGFILADIYKKYANKGVFLC